MTSEQRSIPKLLRFADLKEAGIVNSWPQLKRMVDSSGFPAGFYLSPSVRVWDQSVVLEWIKHREWVASRTSGQ